MQTLFLSDLHLSEKKPAITGFFEQFILYCKENIHDIESIYILGDFLEFWVGDDYQSPLTEQIFAQLAFLAKSSTIKCYFMHGNRDFLFKKGFEVKTGFSIVNDPLCINLDGDKVLLAHGDSLCTDDVAYQQTRQLLRSKVWQDEVLAKSISERIQIALAARQQSKQYQQDKQQHQDEEYIADVNNEAVMDLLLQHQCKTMIHGHTHRPKTHHFELEGHPAQRIVLAAWYKQGSFLKYEDKLFSTIIL